MQKLADTIKLAQQGNNDAILCIIDKFTPLIEKYTKQLNYDEDSKSELILKLISLVRKEINIENLRIRSDGALVNYISCAIRNHYINMSIKNKHTKNNEFSSDLDIPVGYSEEDIYCFHDIEYNLTIDLIKPLLTEREFMCVKLIVFDGWTSEAVAKKIGVSKQAINQCKIRALEKLRSLYA